MERKFSSGQLDSGYFLRRALIYNSLFANREIGIPGNGRRTMTQLVVAVGSTRKPKVGAVEDALREIGSLLCADGEFAVMPVEVESGVGHTPASREEMMKGARLRAEAVREIAKRNSERWDFFVGLEGGLDVVRGEGEQRVFLESWAYVSNGQAGHFGRSGAVEVPEALAHEVLERGIELSVAIDEFAQQTGIRDAQGAWGVLSANKITRQEAFRVAAIAAFAPFYNGAMYRKTDSRRRAAG